MSQTPEDPTERMAAERVATGPAFKRPPSSRPVDPDAPLPYDAAAADLYVTYEPQAPRRAAPPKPEPEPTPDLDRHPAFERSPDPHRGPELPPMDLREMRLRLTAEPAEGRVAGPGRVRPAQQRRRVRRIPWDLVAIGGGAMLAIGAAVAVAVTWIPRIAMSDQAEAAESSVVGPHPPPGH